MAPCGRIAPGFPGHAGGERGGGLQGEAAVEEVQCLNGGRGFAAAGSALTGIRAIKGSKHGFGFAADFVGVDHAPQTVAGEGFHGVESTQAAALIEEVESRAIHLQIQLSADKEHGIADGFGFEPARGKAPQQAGIRILGGGGRVGPGSLQASGD